MDWADLAKMVLDWQAAFWQMIDWLLKWLAVYWMYSSGLWMASVDTRELVAGWLVGVVALFVIVVLVLGEATDAVAGNLGIFTALVLAYTVGLLAKLWPTLPD